MATKAEFKKGQQVVVYTGNYRTAEVSAKEYTVLSCGVKQMHLLRNDGSNAEFRVTAPFRGERRYSDVQCATVDRVAHALALRVQFARWTAAHYAACAARAAEMLEEGGRTPGNLGYAEAIAREQAALEAATADIQHLL